jgi:3-hydroxymyristoyl/3-hydroxydecanoyl-(acyl carrier protein) dehydratase
MHSARSKLAEFARECERPGVHPHFAAFSFVDRIVDFVPATRARGTFAIPASLPEFPSCLVAEAIGQLAAWVAMAHIDFRGRPVAALASETRFHRVARPGEVLTLDIDIASCDDEAVAYRGRAHAGETLLVELVDCLGPMLPVVDFDDPQALRERLALLRGAGAAPGRFAAVALPPLARTGGERGQSAEADFDVPADAPFFADHFPRRQVFPATLLLHAMIGLATEVSAEGGLPRVPSRMSNIKVRSFTPPGQRLQLEAKLVDASAAEARFAISAKADGKAVATARLALAAPPAC